MSNRGPNSSMASGSDWSSQIIPSMDSYDGKVMLAAIMSLLLVILFVLLLHIYTRWLLQQAHRQRSRSMSLSHVLGPTRFHQVRTLAYDGPYSGCSTDDGVDASVIAALPVFVYKSDEYKNGLECVVCLSVFEEEDVGRSLPKCNHAFHVECIDMWLQSHSSCPICRAPVALDKSIGISPLTTGDQPEEESQDAAPAMIISSESAIARERSTTLDVLIELPLDPNGEDLRDISPPPPPGPPPPPPPPPSPPVSPSSLGCSLRRMLSRNRSERKVFPSSNLNELSV